VERLPAVIYIDAADETNSAVYRSPYVERVLGYTPEEFRSHPEFWQSLLHPDDRERVLEENERTNRTGEPFSIEYRMIHKDGHPVWLRDEAVLVRDSAGKPLYWQGVFLEIGRQKEAEQRLAEAEDRYRALVEQVPAVTYTLTAARPESPGAMSNSTLSFMSPQVQKLLGYPPEAFLDDRGLWISLLHPGDREAVVAEDERTDRTGDPFSMEYRMRHADGSYRWVRDEAVLVRNEEGRPRFWHGVLHDVTERRAAEAALRASERRFRSVVQNSSEAVKITTPDGTLRYASPAFERLFGYDPQAAVESGMNVRALTHPEDLPHVIEETERALREGNGSMARAEYRFRCADGSYRPVEGVATFLMDDPAVDGVLINVRDITERKRAEAELRASEERFRSMIQNAPDVVTLLDERGTILYESPSVRQTLGYEPRELVGRNAFEYVHEDDRQEVLEQFLELRSQGGERKRPVPFRFRHKDGSWRYLEGIGSNRLSNPSVRAVVVNSRDVTERRALEEEIRHRAYYDPLTGLPNRALLLERLGRTLRSARRRGETLALLFLDLDDFKVVNDSLGHEAGDALLVEVADRLRNLIRVQDTPGRFGGDEFVVILEDVSRAVADRIAGRVVGELSGLFAANGHELFITVSGGVALSGPDLEPPELLRRADMAMYAAKERGKARHATFEAAMDVEVAGRLELERDLRRAGQTGEGFVLLYQPVAGLATGKIEGFEALLRWEHPELGLLAPERFIPLAERTGLIVPVGRWVLEEVCRAARLWRERFPEAPPWVAVNLSARQLADPDLLGGAERALRRAGLDPGSLWLEITESILMDCEGVTGEVLEGLRRLGIRTGLDDFGTGYSSLSCLASFPMDFLKLDRSVISGIESDPRKLAVARAVLTLAHALGAQVVAEGVETGAQLEQVRELGFDLGQGYHLWSPVTPAEATGLYAAATGG
jgi:diguanylate cyclase (GGDEF)-like protein/PAS domain S-box-containing protein